MQIKDYLLNTNNFLDNDYLEKYCNLIMVNLTTKKIKFKTQQHHIIPKFIYKLANVPVNNKTENLVNLLYKDHCLAHYYLALCSKSTEIAYANFVAIRHILGHTDFKSLSTEQEFIKQLPKYQELYELGRQQMSIKHTGKIISEKTREKERLSHLGKKYKPMSEQGKANIAKAHVGKSTGHRSDKVKNKISNTRKELKLRTINNGVSTKCIPEIELSKWLADGWVLGALSKPMLGKITVVKNNEMRFIEVCELDTYLDTGWKRGRKPHSEEAKKKISQACKNRVGKKYLKWYNNGQIELKAYECPVGFVKGKLKDD